ncbi:distal membrane-arm assembly complex protein 2 [Diorhabda sublineata]|uniref:distal membrane-arm assembly complex protein 2 n=1 Tax=Diorhabda sublineata TaxID=1163346 RepID=UPI0024E16DEE|nr:distal membrane-arm assembly complex protein 2 [Diorhabda sublineata]
MIKFNNLLQLSRPTVYYCNCRLSSNKESTIPVKQEEVKDSVKSFNPKDVTAADMKWRTPWHQKEGQHYSFLRVFYKEETNTSLLQKIQAPIDLSPSAIKKWWAKKKEREAIILQSYIPERNQILGNELAAAHFIVHRGGAIKFFDEDRWIKADENNEYNLPRFFEEDKILQAIDCSNMNLYYEGIANLRDLKQVEWLSFNGCSHIDDWCLDTISNIFSHSLIYLDLRNCPNITSRGIGSLYKLPNLKILYLDDFLKSTQYELTCLLLQEVNPELDIRSDPVTFEISR